MSLLEKIKDHTAKVGVIGLGYVGLPLAVLQARTGYRVYGVDEAAGKVKRINRGETSFRTGEERAENLDVDAREVRSIGMNYTFTFTVFTPTYNRANTLHRVYESLRAQTFRDFEWLVVDDGSTDRTGVLVREWQQQADFPIRYIWQHNQGKHIAFNRAVQEASGTLFLPFDSDDACVPNSLERFYYHWQNISPAERSRFSAVTALSKDQQGQLIGRAFPQQITDSDPLEIRYRYRFKGEKWGFHRTEVLKKFPFPALANSSFCPEGIIWSKIARQFKTRFVNEILRVYYQDFTGTTNQLSRTNSRAKEAQGMVLLHQSRLNEEIGWFMYSPWTFFQSAVHYSRFSFHAGTSMLNQLTRLHTLPAVLWILFFPIGYVLFLRDKKLRV